MCIQMFFDVCNCNQGTYGHQYPSLAQEVLSLEQPPLWDDHECRQIRGTRQRAVGKWVQNRRGFEKVYTRHFDKGRRIRIDSLSGYALLWRVSALRPARRRLLRHESEIHHVEPRLSQTKDTARSDRALASELLANCRLIKGYSDMHTRGFSKFAQLMKAREILAGRADAADWMRRLRTAALEDEKGDALDGALATVESFTTT